MTATSALNLTSLQITGALNNSFVVAAAATAVAVADCLFNDMVVRNGSVLDIERSLQVLSTQFVNVTIALMYSPSGRLNGLMIVRNATDLVFDHVAFDNVNFDDGAAACAVDVTLSNSTASVLLRNVIVGNSIEFSVVLRFSGNGTLVVADVAMPQLAVYVSTSSAFDATVANSTFARCPADGRAALTFMGLHSPQSAVGYANVVLRNVEFVSNAGRSFLYASYGTNVVPYRFIFNHCTFADNYGSFATMEWLAKDASSAVIAEVINSEFRNNTARSLLQQGGAVFLSGNIDLTFNSCSFIDMLRPLPATRLPRKAAIGTR